MKYLILIIAVTVLTGCLRNLDREDKNVEAGHIIHINQYTALDRDYHNTQFIVDNAVLDMRGHTSVLTNSKGESITGVILMDAGQVKNGILVGGYRGVILASNINVTPLKGMSIEDARIYSDTHFKPVAFKDQKVLDMVIRDQSQQAVYVQNFVSSSELKGNTFEDIAKMAVYYDAGSHGNKLVNNRIINTGSAGVWGISQREAVSIDGSYDNVISGNVFRNCEGKACIALFVNCGENGIPRPYGANDNIIRNNGFEDSNIGVYNSSRARIRGGFLHSCRGYKYAEEVKRTRVFGNVYTNVKDHIRDHSKGGFLDE